MTRYFVFELRRLSRDPRFLVLTTLIPLGMYLLLGSIAAEGRSPEAVRSRTLEMTGMAAYAGLMVTITNGGNIAADRALGWISQLRTTPIGARGITLAKMASGLVLAAPTSGLVLLVGALTKNVHLTPQAWAGVVAVTWLGSVPFALLGLAVGYVSTPVSAGPMVMACTLGLAALGGLWIPLALLPRSLQHIARIVPSGGWSDISGRIALGESFHVWDLVSLLGWAVAFAFAASVAYRRGRPH